MQALLHIDNGGPLPDMMSGFGMCRYFLNGFYHEDEVEIIGFTVSNVFGGYVVIGDLFPFVINQEVINGIFSIVYNNIVYHIVEGNLLHPIPPN